MTVRFLKWIKSQMPFIWRWIETVNGMIVALLYGKKINLAANNVLQQYSDSDITYRRQIGRAHV